MASILQKRIFWAVAGIAVAAEAVVVYQQWPSPPLKVCASAELGELLAAAAKQEATLREMRARLKAPDDVIIKDVLRQEVVAAAASNAVAIHKKQAQDKQKASNVPCS
jgi:hypothetical protein